MARAVSLFTMREAARQRANMENSQFVTDAEINAYLNAGLTELYDLLVGSRGQDFYFKQQTFNTVPNQTDYDLPADFYDLLGVDLFVNGRFITLARYEFAERNRYQNPAILSLGNPMVYNIIGSKIRLLPAPSGSTQVTLNYIPAPSVLTDYTDVTPSAGAVLLTPTGGSPAGTSFYVEITGTGNPGTVTFDWSLDGGNTLIAGGVIPLSLSAPLGSTGCTVQFAQSPYVFGTTYTWGVPTFDGVAGWEEYAICHAVVLMLTKQESDPSVAAMMKGALKERIEAMAAGRNQAQPARISDTTIVDYVNLRTLLGYP